MDKSISTKLNKYEMIFLILSAVIIMTLVTTSSPIYPFNVWDDTNVYFTLGREILNGRVPYRDLYEQKGPIFLFMYSFAALISKTGFTGVWVLECIAASLFSVFSWKTVKLFINDIPKYAIGLVPVLLSAVYTLGMFNYGGSAEELCFPLMSVVFFIALKMIRAGKSSLPDKKSSFVCGIIFGIIFWSKYTLLGFIFAFIVLIIIRSIRVKNYKTLLQDILFFLIGVFIISIPVFVYYFANGSLEVLFESYFYNNIFRYHMKFSYSGLFANPVFRFFAIPLMSFWFNIQENPMYMLLWIISIMGVICFDKRYRKEIVVMTAFSLLVCLCMIFSTPIYIYYYGYLLCFYFFFALYAFIKLYVYCRNRSKRQRFIDVITLLVIFFLTFNLLIKCKNFYLLKVEKENMAQFKFAQIINQSEDPKIFTYDIIDWGFYLAADVSPSNRYFTTMNFIDNNPEAVEEQQRLIREGYFDYIITIDTYDWDNYELIATSEDRCVDFTKEEFYYRYNLYQRTDANA